MTDTSFLYKDTVLHYVKITDSTRPEIIGREALLYSYDFATGDASQVTATVSLSSKESYSFYSDNIYLSGNIKEVHSSKYIKSFDSFITKLRTGIRNILFKSLPYNIATTINGLTIGDRSYEESDFYNAVKKCGVSHVMVVSGMHMVIVCGSFYKLLEFIKLSPQITSILTLCITLGFMALCGFTPSVIRAGFMYIIMLIGKLFFRDPDALNSLSVAFVFMLIVNPFLLANVGFLLSVVSTAGIIILNPLLLKLIRIDKWKSKPLRAITELATVTISAQIATLPLCLYFFGWVSPWAVLVNILISHAVTIAVISAFLGIAFYSIPALQPISFVSFKICSFMTAYFNKVMMFFGNL